MVPTRARLLIADVVVDDDGGQGDAAEVDDDLLSRALGPGAQEAVAYLRDCYRRLG